MPTREAIINANDLGETVVIDCRNASYATAQVLPGDGQALTSVVFSKCVGNVAEELVVLSGPSTISQFGISAAIDVRGYAFCGLRVTTAEGSDKMVRVILHTE